MPKKTKELAKQESSIRGIVNEEYIEKVLEQLAHMPAYRVLTEGKGEKRGCEVVRFLVSNTKVESVDVKEVSFGDLTLCMYDVFINYGFDFKHDEHYLEAETFSKPLNLYFGGFMGAICTMPILQELLNINFLALRKVDDKHLNQCCTKEERDQCMKGYSYAQGIDANVAFNEVCRSLHERTKKSWIPMRESIREYQLSMYKTYLNIFTDVFTSLYFGVIVYN